MLEASEKIEQLRYLEFGKRIKMVETTHVGIGIDTPEDLEKRKMLYYLDFRDRNSLCFTLVEKKFKKSTMKTETVIVTRNFRLW
jgi:hypothetical protein